MMDISTDRSQNTALIANPPVLLPLEGEGEGAGVPLYLQVAATLRTAIVRGIYPVGSRIPTEDELCRHFKISRHTVREALRRLRDDGLIVSRPGSRPTVATPAMDERPELFSGIIGEDFFDYMIGTRLAIESMEMVTLTRKMAADTGLPAGEQWLSVMGYRRQADDGGITCWHEYLVRARYATIGRILARHVGPMLPLMEDLFNIRVVTITRSTSAIPMPAAHAFALGTNDGSPALNIVTRCETADGEVALLNRSIHPSGVISYTIRR
jgi:GntR family transcriptional regulator